MDANPHLGRPLAALVALQANRNAVLDDVLTNNVPLTLPTVRALLADLRHLSNAIDRAVLDARRGG